MPTVKQSVDVKMAAFVTRTKRLARVRQDGLEKCAQIDVSLAFMAQTVLKFVSALTVLHAITSLAIASASPALWVQNAWISVPTTNTV
jgi:hypothetical protein